MRRSRIEVRMLCADMVEICWKDPAGRKSKATALLEDISQSGMCIQLEASIPVGASIQINCPGEKLTGMVRYCVYREIGYFVGIELDKTTLWSRKHFEPRHLLDLQKLVLHHAGKPGGRIQ
jgi:hypothetical protein